MIEIMDGQVAAWIHGVVGDDDVVFGSPDAPIDPRSDAADAGGRVRVYLLEMSASSPPRTTQHPRYQLTLRYLITTRDEDPQVAHRLLGALVLDAMSHPDFHAVVDPLPAAMWTALGAAPRPSFVLEVQLRAERPVPTTGIVLHELELDMRTDAAMVTLDGLVVGPGDIPLADARVELPSIGLVERTDARGRFRFRAVPREPTTRRIHVTAKDKQMTLETDRGATTATPLTIRFNKIEV